jgi:hypothetical protein
MMSAALPSDSRSSSTTERVSGRGGRSCVLVSAAEAVPLFLSYWQTNDIPRGYPLRALDL